VKQLLESILVTPRDRRQPTTTQSRVITRTPDLPAGFVRRSDPNFYFLARKF
jgi:hypothetical protein